MSDDCAYFLAKLGAVSNLSEPATDTLRDLCVRRKLIDAKRHIIREGERPAHVHIILDGWAARYKVQKDGSRQIVAFLLPGDICDLHATILTRMDHSILALTRVQVAFVPAELMDEVPVSRPELLKALWRATLIDEAVLRAWIANNGRRRALPRLAHLICELHARLKLVGLVDDGHFRLPATQEVLADAMGLTAVHVNRALQELRGRGLVALDLRELQILNLPALKELCGFDDSYLHLGKMADHGVGQAAPELLN